jgi:hypothetical protein
MSAHPFRDGFQLTPAQEELVAKLRADGTLIREKAKTLLEHLGIPELHRQLRDPDTSNTHKLDVIKYLSKLSDVDPKPTAQASTGERFTINISMPGAATPGVPPATPPITIDAVPVPLPPEEPEPEAPGPQPFPVPGFKLDMNLVGYAPSVPPTAPGAHP